MRMQSTVLDPTFCRDSIHPTRHIPNLPRLVLLTTPGASLHAGASTGARNVAARQGTQPKDAWPGTRHGSEGVMAGLRLSLDYARRGREVDECRALARAAALTADDVGVDEYEGNEGRLDELFAVSEVFVLKETTRQDLIENKMRGVEQSSDDSIKACIAIRPGYYCRSQFESCMAQILIFNTPDLQPNDLQPHQQLLPAAESYYQQLLRQAVGLTQLIDAGYTQCMVRVAASSMGRIAALRQEGFIIVAVIPACVNIAGTLTDDLVFVKLLQLPQRPKRSLESILAAVDRHYPPAEVDRLYQTATLPRVPFLPQTYRFLDGRTVITIRNMDRSEDEAVYAIWNETQRQGAGYGIHDYPTLAMFRATKLLVGYCVIFELQHLDQASNETASSRGEILGLTIIADACYSRTPRSGYCETSHVLAPPYRGRGFGVETLSVEAVLCSQLGYTGNANDTLASNARMFGTLRRATGDSMRTLGVLPRAAYTEGVGWDDLVVQLIQIKDLAEMAVWSTKQQEVYIAHKGRESKL